MGKPMHESIADILAAFTLAILLAWGLIEYLTI